jgi:MarR family transcriptional regulator, organic hydroperoxide resistance regulator
MARSDSQVAADWELAKLVHELDIQSNGRQRDRVGRLGLTVAQASALRELTAPMISNELAERMGCEPSNATPVIDTLERQKLLERRPHPTDRRAKQLTLTAAGVARREELLKALTDEEPLLVGLTGEEQATLESLVRRALAAR